MSYKKFMALVTVLSFTFSCVAPGFAEAGEFKVFGPKTYVRGSGDPHWEIDSFDVLNPNTSYKLKVVNGPGDYHRILGAFSKLNGTYIAGILALNLLVGSVTIPISVAQGTNTISFKLLGLPNSALKAHVFGIDNVPPSIQITSPQNNQNFTDASVLAQISISDALAGIDPQTYKILLNGVDKTSLFTQPTVSLSFNSSGTLTLESGSNIIAAEVKDRAGNQAQHSITVTFSATANQSPTVQAGQDQTVTLPDTASLSGTANDDGLPTGSSLTTTWSKFSGPGTVTFGNANNLSTTATFSDSGTYILRLTASDTALSSFDDVQITAEQVLPPLPPDPATVAPPLDATVATTPFEAMEFIYSGPNPIQTGVAPGTIDFVQSALLRGKVMDKNNDPLPGVTITILDRPEFGSTLSRADGMFDMVINGGGLLTVQYERDGYLTVTRQTDATWQEYAWMPDVVMVALDAQATAVSQSAEIQVAGGSVVSDIDGVRQATLLFSPSTTATLVMPDNSTVPLTDFNVRATEYTVGANGKASMPAELPASSGYTYAVEYSMDEAMQAGAKKVEFNQPVISYTENFIGFPVGGIVPAAYLDSETKRWIPSENGRIIKILSITGGSADIDIDGSNTAASPLQLSTLGITPEEQETLAQRYAAGQSLWRVPIAHFSPWDFNWPYGPPTNAILPSMGQPSGPGNHRILPCSNVGPGSEIQYENQVLGERADVVGTPFSLKYQSDRVSGFKANDSRDIPLTPASIPSSLKRIDLRISIAGRLFTQSFTPAPDLTHEFIWDRQDAFGRTVQGQQTVTIRIGYVYDLIYQEPANQPQSFGLLSGALLAGNLGREGNEVTFLQERRELVGIWDVREQNLGGWALSQHHAYEPLAQVFHPGDGKQRNVDNLNFTLRRAAGGGGNAPAGIPALQAQLGSLKGIDVTSDGSYYFVDGRTLLRVDTNGVITIITGSNLTPNLSDVAVAPDGSIYFAELEVGQVVKKIAPDQSISVVAGGGTGGDGALATQALLDIPNRIALGKDRSVYILERDSRIRKVSPSGVISTVVGTGVSGFSGDGGPAITAQISAADFSLGPNDEIYIADTSNHRVRKVGNDGIITTIAGTGDQFGILGSISAIAVDKEGVVYVFGNGGLVRIDTDSIVTQEPTRSGSNFLYSVVGMAFAPDGSLYIANPGDGNFFQSIIQRLLPPLPGFSRGEVLIASPDAKELYIFDKFGKHLRTLDALTQGVLYSFSYNTSGHLIKITDGDGNETTIVRDGSGAPTSITGPFGQQTAIELDPNGFLKKIIDLAGNTREYVYSSDGLLENYTDPDLKTYNFTFNGSGLLTKDEDPLGGFQELVRTTLPNGGFLVSKNTALNRTTQYKYENIPNSGQRRTTIHPDGSQNTADLNAMPEPTQFGAFVDKYSKMTSADGTLKDVFEGPDPRWGIQAPFVSRLVTSLPGGLVSNITATRTAFGGSPEDPFAMLAQSETVTVNGKQYTSVFDVVTNTFTKSTPLNRQSVKTVDAQGRVVSQAVTGVDAVNFTYDPQGRLQNTTQGTGVSERETTFAYDPASFLQSVTDAESRVVSFEYDLAGRVTKQTLPGNRDILYSYDANGNVTSITPPGRPAHLFQYTDVNLQSEYNPPDVGLPLNKTVYSFNLDKDLTLITRPDGQTLAFNYEPSGRLDNLTVPSGVIDYFYHPTTGQVSSVAFPGGDTCAYQYDGFLMKKEIWTGPVTGHVDHDYDNDFRLTSLVINGVSPISFGYDNDSLLTTAGSQTLSRDAQNGLLTGTTLGNVTDSFGYNTFAEVQSYTANYSGSPVYQTSFLRDKLGRITQKTETLNSITAVYDYTYDLEGRIEEVKKDNVVTATYVYDANGNRAPGTYDAQDRLTQYGANTYTYSANGELQTKTAGADVTAYTYDVLGNLTNVMLPDATQLSYVIDGQNRRVGKRINGSLTQGFLYRNGLSPVAELDGSNNVASVFVYGSKANIPDHMTKAGNTYRIISDHLGSPRLVIDTTTGIVVQQMDYDEFGNVTNDTNPGFQPFGFAGGLYDPQTKLVRFGVRDYDAEVGRWTSKDPILFDGGDANLYGYVMENPVNYVDNDGKAIGPWIAGALFVTGFYLLVRHASQYYAGRYQELEREMQNPNFDPGAFIDDTRESEGFQQILEDSVNLAYKRKLPITRMAEEPCP